MNALGQRVFVAVATDKGPQIAVFGLRRLAEPPTPVAETTKPTVGIKVAEDLGTCLVGEVWGHPRIPNGHTVQTSRIVGRDPFRNEIETLNTIYRLL